MAVTISQGTTGVVTHTFTVNGTPMDLTGSTVRFLMRRVTSDTTTVDAAATITNAAAGLVQYQLTATDTATTGDHLAWWVVTLPTTMVMSTTEFLVEVTAHTTGLTQLCTVGEVKTDPTIMAAGHTLDGLIIATIQHVTQEAMRVTGREFVNQGTPGPHARLIQVPPYAGSCDIPIGDLAAAPTLVEAVTITSAGESATTIPTTGWVTLPLSRPTWAPVTRLRFHDGVSAPYLRVTGTWGWPEIPDDLRAAATQTVQFRLRQTRALTTQSPTQYEDPGGPQRGWPYSAWQVLNLYRTPTVA